MTPLSSEDLVERVARALRAEAAACRTSAVGNGEYNAPFWTAGIVLDRLADTLEAALSLLPDLEGEDQTVSQSQPISDGLRPTTSGSEPSAGEK